MKSLQVLLLCCVVGGAAFAYDELPDPAQHGLAQGEQASLAEPPAATPMLEDRRILFPTPLPDLPVGISLPPGDPQYVYLLGRNGDIAVMDADTGELRETVAGPRTNDIATSLFLAPEDPQLLIAARTDGVFVYDLSKPESPVATINLGGCGGRQGAIPAGRFVLVSGPECAYLVEPRTNRTVAILASEHTHTRIVGASRSLDRPIVVRADYADAPLFNNAAAYRIVDGDEPELLSSWSFDGVPTDEIMLDAVGSIAVIPLYSGAVGLRFEVRDTGTGLLLSEIAGDPSPGAVASALVDTSFGPRLALMRSTGTDVWDLADAVNPRLLGHFDVSVFVRQYSDQAVARPLVSTRAATLLIPDPRRQEVVALDLETLRETGSASIPDGFPVQLAEDRLAAIPRVAVHAVRRLGELVIGHGGTSLISVVHFDPPSPAAVVSQHLSISPQDIDVVAPFGGRFVASLDLYHNVVAVSDTSTGRLISASGAARYLYASRQTDIRLVATNTTIAIGDLYGFDAFDLIGGTLVPRTSVVRWPGYDDLRALQVTPDGVVLALFQSGLVTSLPDGRSAFLPAETPIGTLRLEFDPATRLAVTGPPDYGQVERFFAFDISDPLQPKVAWQHEGTAFTVQFARGGSAVAITEGDEYQFAPRLLDSATGEALGDASRPVPKFYYHGYGCSFGTGSEARVVYWHWTYLWQNRVFDLSTDTPTLLASSPIYGLFPEFTAQTSGRGWYEAHYVSPRWSRLWRGATDGSLADVGLVDTRKPYALREGFLVGRSQTKPDEVVVLRDPEANRPPHAVAGGDRRLECDHGTASVVLDAGASYDPDSAPGTQDDLATYHWLVDGVTASRESVTTQSLNLGRHGIQLELEDRLGAPDDDTASITIEDTEAPALTASLEPEVSSAVFANRWEVVASAQDGCDAAVTVEAKLRVPVGHRVPSTSYVPSLEFGVDVFVGVRGIRVELRGPDRDQAARLWQGVIDNGEVSLRIDELVTLRLHRVAARSSLVARYRFAADATLLAADAFGADADLLVAVHSADGAGNVAEAVRSLRRRIAELCAVAPAHSMCAR